MTTATAELKSVSAGHFLVTGVLGFDTAQGLLAAGRSQFMSVPGPIEVDLAGVSQSDSAGLALLIEWLKQASQAEQGIRFTRVPEQLRALARISELDGVLPI